jgi:hypothetical protein
VKGNYGASEGVWIDLLGDIVPEILLPLVVEEKITDRKRDVCVEVFFVLLEDDIPPGGVEIPAHHAWP